MKMFWSYSIATQFPISSPLEAQDQFIPFRPRCICIHLLDSPGIDDLGHIIYIDGAHDNLQFCGSQYCMQGYASPTEKMPNRGKKLHAAMRHGGNLMRASATNLT